MNLVSDFPLRNRLLAAMEPEEMATVVDHFEPVKLRLGEMVYEPGQQMRHACFPVDSIISLHHVMASGAAAATTAVGREGMVGIALIMGGQSMPSSAMVQTAGHALRLERWRLVEVFERGGPMQRVLLRYTQAVMTQIAQTAVCNRHHSILQQLSRWLLETFDRVPSRELVVTQELVAGALGVRRESITEAAGRLQAAGLIRYRRGHISVLDAPGLERVACECYAQVKSEFMRLRAMTA